MAPSRKPVPLKEDKIQQQIISYLSFHAQKYNFIFFSVPNETLMTVLTAFRIDKNTCFRLLSHFKKMGMTPGVSDLIIMKDGKSYCMELKRPDTATKKYTQSKNQIIFEQKCIKTGVPYEVVRSLDMAVNCLHLWGVL
jgi:hypothetical protein